MKRVLAVLVWCAASVGCVAEDLRQPIPSSSEVSKRLILDNFQDETLCSEIGAYLEERIYPLNKWGEIKPLADWKEYEINYKIDGKIEEAIEVFETTNGPIKDKKLLVRKKTFIRGRPYHIIYFLNKEDYTDYPVTISTNALHSANQINPIRGLYDLRNSRIFKEPLPSFPNFIDYFNFKNQGYFLLFNSYDNPAMDQVKYSYMVVTVDPAVDSKNHTYGIDLQCNYSGEYIRSDHKPVIIGQ